MTPKGDGQPLLYQVNISEKIREATRELFQEAVQQGRGQRFLASLRTIYDRLQHDPKNFGELLYPLPALKLLIFQVVVAPVVVDYGLHEDEPLVFIKGVKLLG